MNTYQSQRIRFGILAARHMLERGRLTASQVEDLEGMEVSVRRAGDEGTQRAFDHERFNVLFRINRKKWLAP